MERSRDLHHTAERSFAERSFSCRMQNTQVSSNQESISRMEIEGRKNLPAFGQRQGQAAMGSKAGTNSVVLELPHWSFQGF